ncbi:MAG: T9SS type A sorting domain-containing protein, partial [Bacteroidota bacterium]
WGDSLTMMNSLRSFVRVDSFLYLCNGPYDGNHISLSIIKTDLEGNVIKKQKYNDTTLFVMINRVNSILLDKDSNIVVCSYMFDRKRPGTREYGFVVKLDRQLDTIWTRRFSLHPLQINCDSTDTTSTIMQNIKQSVDNNYIITGVYYKDCIFRNSARVFMMGIDTLGNLLWTRSSDNLWSIWDLARTPDSCYVFPEFSDGHYYLNKMNRNGNMLWRKKVHNEVHLNSGQIEINNKGEIVTFAPIWYKNNGSINNPMFKVHVLKFDLNGNQIWSKIYDFYDFQCSGIHQNFELKILPNDDIIIAGTAYFGVSGPGTGMYKGVLFKLNDQGDSLWTRFYSKRHPYDVTEFNGLTILPNGGFIAGGDHKPYDFYGWGAWLVHTDSMGFCPGYYSLGKEDAIFKGSSLIIPYPNPAGDYIIFDLSSVFVHNKFDLKLYNTAGFEVMTTSFSSMINKVHIEDLESGVYFYKLQCRDTGKIFTGKFIKI